MTNVTNFNENNQAIDAEKQKRIDEWEQRKVNKKAYFEEQAKKAKERADAHVDKVNDNLGAVWGGQPILVGHHSEGKHRRMLQRTDNHMRKYHEEMEKSEYYENKANIDDNSIRSNDPQAIEKLQALIEQKKISHELSKKINAYFRKVKNETYEEVLAKLDLMGVPKEITKKLVTYSEDRGLNCISISLPRSLAEIKRLQERLASIEKYKKRGDDSASIDNLCVYKEDTINMRVEFNFCAKPNAQIIMKLKRSAFKWSPQAGVWTRVLTNASVYAGRQLYRELKAMQADK